MSIIFLEAIAPWLEGPARGLAEFLPVTALQHVSYGARRKLSQPISLEEGQFSSRTQVFPPGFAGTLSFMFTPVIRRGINRLFARMEPSDGFLPHMICPFPYAEPWTRGIPDGQLVYYNVDDYRLYRKYDAAKVVEQEDALIRRSRITVCVARHQAENFRARHPEHADRIHHLPHGLAPAFLNPAPEQAPTPDLVGYVGNLTDRVDWDFVDAVVQGAPELTFEFTGRAGNETAPWAATRATVFARENVRFLGPVPQAEVPPYYWRSAVNWMPYATDHPFNIASSPTKIFDAFGSGRPFVSTRIPEVECYADRISIVDSTEQAIAALRETAARHDPQTAREMCEFARNHLWQNRAEQLLALLQS